ncbi:MAG: 2-phospho-L-lactate transferase [Betaproteobacteria bacterium]|nr:2-phospho-L-lactate transferase [Betaproteobacteria bacterium]
MIVALAGGVGGARLAVGLAAVLPPQRLTVVVNTGDDFEHLGLSICPDLDTVMYTLAGLNNPALGWGRADETWSFMETLQALGGETWFRLGDRDLAVHVLRTAALARGERLSDITRTLTQRFGIAHAVVPMSDDRVRTVVLTNEGELAFQDYFVRRRCAPAVSGFRFEGAEDAEMPQALRAIVDGDVEAVVVCPSNPFVSIAPMLAVPAIREWLERRTFPVVAVSPIVGGDAVKGPAAKMMRELGVDASASGVARHYGSLVDAWVIDERDASEARAIAALGKRVRVTDTLMTDTAKSAALAEAVLEVAGEASRG